MRWCSLLLLATSLLAGGCQRNVPTAVVAADAIDDGLPKEAQSKLQTMKLWIGPEEVSAELALRSREIQTGMMFRTNAPENTGMLFVLPGGPQRASFWMKNCPLALSAAYIDSEGRILEIRDFVPHNTNAVVASSDRVQYVLETGQGWFDRKGIKSGTVIRTERGTLKETFFERGN